MEKKMLFAVALLAVLVVALTISILMPGGGEGENLLLVYTRRGGIAGMNDTLIVYLDGRAMLTHNGRVFQGFISPEELGSLKSLIHELEAYSGFNCQPKPGAADFFSYSITAKNLRVDWVDPWACQGGFPQELESLHTFMEKITSQLTQG